MRMGRPVAILTAATLAGVLLLGAAASAATAPSAPAGGPVQIFGTPNISGAGGTIVITGAIGDYGTTLNIDKDGKTDSNGNYVKVTLKKGTFEVNKTALQAAGNEFNPAVNKATCSADGTQSAPVTLFDGTGAYKGITGTVSITVTEAFILPFFKSGKDKGQCNLSNNSQPLAVYASVAGSGNVSFS